MSGDRRLWLLTLLAIAVASVTAYLRGPGESARADTTAKPAPAAVAPDTQPASARRALLVGVTQYPHLPKGRWLEGPENDVKLVRKLLLEKFGFADSDIITLSEGDDPRLLPTRDNILNQLRTMVKNTKEGDKIVVYLSGHGSFQPYRGEEEPGRARQVNGLFLPRDTKSWTNSGVENAITDRELNKEIVSLRDRNAALWVVVDACHSGGLARAKPRGPGAEVEVAREIPPQELGIPADLLASAEQSIEEQSEQSRGADGVADATLELATTVPGMAATYACRATEETFERPFPLDRDPTDPETRRYGIFTHTLFEVLSRAAGPMTYAEVSREVLARYAAMGRVAPIPLVEGAAAHKEILGEAVRRSDIRLTRDGSGLRVNVGRMHGFNNGSIFAVYPPPGGAPGDPVGYVEVEDAKPLHAYVKPCSYKDTKATPAEQLKEGSVCRPEFVDFGIEPLKLHLEPSAAPRLKAVVQRLAAAEKPKPLFTLTPEMAQAQFLLGLEDPAKTPGRGGTPDANRRLTFAPRGATEPLSVSAGGGSEAEIERAFTDTCRTISQAISLLQVAQSGSGSGGGLYPKPEINVEMYKLRALDDPEPKLVKDYKGAVLHPGELVAFKMTNLSNRPLDMTVLFVDSAYGIQQYFPRPGVTGANRVPQKQFAVTDPLRITEETVGVEHLVVIAVASDDPPLDFSFLSQSTLQGARKRGETSKGQNKALLSPLGQLLQNSQYQQGGVRGGTVENIGQYVTEVLSWTTSPKKE